MAEPSSRIPLDQNSTTGVTTAVAAECVLSFKMENNSITGVMIVSHNNQVRQHLNRVSMIVTGMLGSLLLRPTVADEEQPLEPPNIVVILADDLGYGDVSCYNKQSRIPTPHIDRLAEQGIRFTDAHSPSSVCSPTRYGLLTGRYAWRTELKRRVLWAFDGPLIEANRLTLPQMLRERGYRTACFGKWHLGWVWKVANGSPLKLPFKIGEPGHDERVRHATAVDYSLPLGGGPLAAGFDYYFGDDMINQPPYLWIENDRCLTVPELPELPGMLRGSSNGPATQGWNQKDVLPKTTQRTIQWIEQQGTPNEPREQPPFFLYFALTAPHEPIVPPAEFLGTSKFGEYGDFVVYVDWVVGQVMSALKDSGLSDNTIVVFTSDNGSWVEPKDGHQPNGRFRGKKGMIFDGGHRVPFIMRWPGHLSAGSTNQQLIGLNDLLATFADVVGYEIPEYVTEDSVSLVPTLRDSSVSVRDMLIHHSASGEFAIRAQQWKLIPQKRMLFDMETDPQENDNLWSTHPEVVDRLTNILMMSLPIEDRQGALDPKGDVNRLPVALAAIATISIGLLLLFLRRARRSGR